MTKKRNISGRTPALITGMGFPFEPVQRAPPGDRRGDTQPDSFAKFIRSIRLGKEESLQELAEKLGVSRGHLCNVENGRRRIGLASAAEWATALGFHESKFVLLALQADLDAAGIKLRVQLEAPSHADVSADIASRVAP